MDCKDNEKTAVCSRRQFFGKIGLATVAGVTATIIGPALLNSSQAEAKATVDTPKYPYKKLDPKEIMARAHAGYYENACAYGVAYALISALREEVGEPYTYIPPKIMQWARGGGKGFTGTCGALVSACSISNLILDNKTANQIALELENWYCDTKFPSDLINKLASNKELKVNDYKTSKELPQTKSGSILCHVSVTRWCKASGYASGSPERSERCARITGDVAYKLTELLNQVADGTFERKHKIPPEVNQCRSCHSKGTPYEKGHWSRGKMRCNNCHGADLKGTAKRVLPDHYSGWYYFNK